MFENEASECPLCMEPYEIDDLNFFPCACGYQVCRFCWHRIRNDENGLCPACRKTYTESPAVFQPLTSDEVQRIKKNQKQKDQMKKHQTTESRKHLASVRVIQKNLLFIVGLSNKLADADVLKRNDMLGKYGKILKIVINPCTNYAGPQGPSASAYVTYSKEEETQQAILSVNNVTMDGRLLRASLGTTKYCSYFLKSSACPKTDCMYLHDVADQEASFTKEDMQLGKHQIFEKNLLDRFLASLSSNGTESQIKRQTPSPGVKAAKIKRPDSDQSNTSTGSGRNSVDRKTSFTYADSSDRSSETGASEDWPKDDNSIDPNYPALPLRPITNTTATQNTTTENGSSCQSETELPDSNARQLHPNTESNTTLIPPSLGFLPGQNQVIPDWASSSPSYEAADEQAVINDATIWPDSGLGLSHLHAQNDDDLDFDPFEESNIGLTSLINQESSMSQSSSFYMQQSQPFGSSTGTNEMRDLWHRPFAQNESSFQQQSNGDYRYSLFGSDVMRGSVCNPSLLMGGPQLYSKFDAKQNPDIQTSSRMDFSQFAGTEDPSTLSPTVNAPNQQQQQQANLRALLPDVNISFTGQTDARQNQGAERLPARRPPPGFESTPSPVSSTSSINDPSVVLWSKLESAPVQTKEQMLPPGFPNDVLPNGDVTTKPSSNKPLEETRPRRNPSEQTRMTQPVTPWTSVVRTSLKKPTQSNGYASATNQTTNATIAIVPPTTSVNTSSPFATKKSPVTEKPTAKVKPLNHTTTPPVVRVPHLPDPPLNVPPVIGRNMNELDDFDIDEPTVIDVVSKCGAGPSVVPAPVSRKEPMETSKSKKKKKGKKQHNDQPFVETKVVATNRIGSMSKKNESTEVKHFLKTEYSMDKHDGVVQINGDNQHGTATGSNALGCSEQDMFSRLAESTEKLLQSVLCETEAIKSNTEQISKDLKTAIERGMEYPPTRADLAKINSLLQRTNLTENVGEMKQVDTAALEKQVETAKREATLLEAKLNDLIRKNVSTNQQSKK